MTTDSDEQTQKSQLRMSRGLVTIWSVGVGGLVLFTSLQIGTAMYGNRRAADVRHDERMNAEVLESGLEPKDAELPPGAAPVEVHTGVYIDRIVELSVKETGWTVDFYVWFRWKGDAVNPGEDFSIIDGWIEEKTEGSGAGRGRRALRALSRRGAHLEVLRCHALSGRGTPVDDRHRAGVEIAQRSDPGAGL